VVLAILEYINYYHYQLQHFDHAADFARLLSGRGFRRSHLSKAIAAWKRAAVRQGSERQGSEMQGSEMQGSEMQGSEMKSGPASSKGV
jgi:hypothetical protein